MKDFLRSWKDSFNEFWFWSILVMIVMNAGSFILGKGASEIDYAVQQHGVGFTIVLLAVSIVLNALILDLIASFIRTLFDKIKEML